MNDSHVPNIADDTRQAILELVDVKPEGFDQAQAFDEVKRVCGSAKTDVVHRVLDAMVESGELVSHRDHAKNRRIYKRGAKPAAVVHQAPPAVKVKEAAPPQAPAAAEKVPEAPPAPAKKVLTVAELLAEAEALPADVGRAVSKAAPYLDVIVKLRREKSVPWTKIEEWFRQRSIKLTAGAAKKAYEQWEAKQLEGSSA